MDIIYFRMKAASACPRFLITLFHATKHCETITLMNLLSPFVVAASRLAAALTCLLLNAYLCALFDLEHLANWSLKVPIT